MTGVDGMPPKLAYVHGFDDPRDYGERLCRLIEPVMQPCLETIARLDTLNWVRMLVLLPRWMEGTPHAAAIMQRIDRPARVHRPEARFGSNAEGLAAVGEIARAIYNRSEQAVCICSVDSHIHPNLLNNLAIDGRILAQGNPYGMVPGEAAAAVLVSHAGFMKAARPLGQIMQAGDAIEPEDVASPRRVIGRGLASCFGFGEEAGVSRFIADLNGERYRGEELGFAAANAPAHMADLLADPETPALQFGDVGAATGCVYAALALAPPPPPRNRFGTHDRPAGDICAISTSSRSGRRATLVVKRLEEASWRQPSA